MLQAHSVGQDRNVQAKVGTRPLALVTLPFSTFVHRNMRRLCPQGIRMRRVRAGTFVRISVSQSLFYAKFADKGLFSATFLVFGTYFQACMVATELPDR